MVTDSISSWRFSTKAWKSACSMASRSLSRSLSAASRSIAAKYLALASALSLAACQPVREAWPVFRSSWRRRTFLSSNLSMLRSVRFFTSCCLFTLSCSSRVYWRPSSTWLSMPATSFFRAATRRSISALAILRWLRSRRRRSALRSLSRRVCLLATSSCVMMSSTELGKDMTSPANQRSPRLGSRTNTVPSRISFLTTLPRLPAACFQHSALAMARPARWHAAMTRRTSRNTRICWPTARSSILAGGSPSLAAQYASMSTCTRLLLFVLSSKCHC
mmetsp:Transcript_14676/g.32217  ORF Transcript_14676/g.32217 Transcript_14676/m.32217 type:complete len:276 (+) Transcript_14676:315-1142(+)